jgi:hypothetical protein
VEEADRRSPFLPVDEKVSPGGCLAAMGMQMFAAARVLHRGLSSPQGAGDTVGRFCNSVRICRRGAHQHSPLALPFYSISKIAVFLGSHEQRRWPHGKRSPACISRRASGSAPD